jgi:hypothetical protein
MKRLRIPCYRLFGGVGHPGICARTSMEGVVAANHTAREALLRTSSSGVPVFVQALKVAVHVLDATPLTMLSCEGGRVRARRYTCNDVVLLSFTVRPGGEYVGLPRESLRR